MLRVLFYLVPLILAVYALVDCVLTDDSEVRGIPKWAWIVLIVLVGVVGPVAWLVAGKTPGSKRELPWRSGGGPGRPGQGRPGPRRPTAPDDDPDFLRGLGRRPPERRKDDDSPEKDGPTPT